MKQMIACPVLHDSVELRFCRMLCANEGCYAKSISPKADDSKPHEFKTIPIEKDKDYEWLR